MGSRVGAAFVMWTCKQVSRALQQSDYMKLSPLSRLALRLHVACCVVCGRSNRQVMAFYDGIRAFLRIEERDQGPLADETRLPDKTRRRIKDALNEVSARGK